MAIEHNGAIINDKIANQIFSLQQNIGISTEDMIDSLDALVRFLIRLGSLNPKTGEFGCDDEQCPRYYLFYLVKIRDIIENIAYPI